MKLFTGIITHVLASIYQVFGVSLLLSFLFLFAVLYCGEHGVKESFKKIAEKFKTDRQFRLVFFCALYIAMILCKTLFCRTIWEEPFRDVIGVWGIRDKKGQLYTENIENVVLFLPFTFLLLCVLKKHRFKSVWNYLWKATAASLGLSLFIELMQLFLKVGAVQLSDLVFNSLGGFLGCVLYLLCFRRKIKQETDP